MKGEKENPQGIFSLRNREFNFSAIYAGLAIFAAIEVGQALKVEDYLSAAFFTLVAIHCLSRVKVNVDRLIEKRGRN